MLTGSQRGALTARRGRRISAQRLNRAAEHVECLLRAPRFHRRGILCLAERERYANAVHALARIAEPDRLIAITLPALFAVSPTADIFLRRLCLRFGLLPPERKNQPVSRMRREDVQALASQSEGARLVLAALGEVDWPAASTRERAIYCLAALVAAFKRRVS